MTLTTLQDPSILKTDTKGRVRTPAAKREQILQEFEKSGLSGVKFAELVGVKYQTLATWLQKRRMKKAASAAPSKPDSVQWVQAIVNQPRPASGCNGLTVRLPDGSSIEISEIGQIDLAVAFLLALRKAC